MICSRSRRVSIFALLLAPIGIVSVHTAQAQQTLGAITGVVTDPGGAILPGTTVTAVNTGTGLKRTQTAGSNGFYEFQNLPIGTYTLTFTLAGFEVEKVPSITVQADRTITLPAQLKVGAVSDSVTVDASPLLNAVDTTNGYVLDKAQLEAIPLTTGSFTGVAILSPGVNAELPSGSGSNAGLGNLPIWANGQRDTSNSFALNGVDASNLFNGKSTSQVGSARVVNSTGVSSGSGAGGVIQTAASIYLSIGNAIPTPAPETIEEVRVNASMYDASQGSTSGAHIDLATSSGTNNFHGSLYGHRATNWLNAAPFFFKNDDDIPENDKNPELHRYILGGTFGGPIIKNKLFVFLSYQHLHVADQEIGDGFLNVPVGLSDTNRDASNFAGIVNAQYGTSLGSADIDHTALALFNSPSLPGEPGKWLIPNDTGSSFLSPTHPYDAFLPGTGRFDADLAVANLDYNATSKDTIALKYYYQHDPTIAPYSYSSVPGFTEHLDSGAQVFSIINTLNLRSNLSTTQTIGFLREKIYGKNEQPFGPSNIPGGAAGNASINEFGSNYFPGVSIYNVLGDAAYAAGVSTGILNIGPNAEGQAPNTGVFQNRLQPSGNAIWTYGKHTVSFGLSYEYTQLNTADRRTNTGTVATDDLSAFAQGYVTPGSSSTGFYVSSFLRGNANRYYRANELGSYVQDKFQVTPHLSLTAGLRYDWDGGLTEKNGNLFNFDPNRYNYNSSGDVINDPGFVIAGNNANGTSGVSNTTLTGRQWGIGPRVGAAWSPAKFKDKLVVRVGSGMYYDRGELFSYFSPGYAIGTVTGGPFGVNQQLPFVTAQSCPTGSLYDYYIPTCSGGGGYGPPTGPPVDAEGDLANPYTNVPQAAPSNPKASDLKNYLPNLAAIGNGGQPISLGVYDRANKLPYTYNYTLDMQWQPRNDLAIELGYVGNLGRHQVIPVPFNQPGIASPSNKIHGESYSYGYQVQGPANCAATFSCAPLALPDGTNYRADYEGGNLDHRVPYVGYAAESIDYKAAGIDAYNALTAHIEKRMSHGVQVGMSYTYSHALDEQSGLGLFYNGNNPLNLRDGYASADFDRTHVLNFNYVYRLPDFYSKETLQGKFTDGWSLVGLTVLQSGQPYSVIDFSGAIGSLYYSTSDGITNPIVPLDYSKCSPKSAKTGLSGAFGDLALNAACFTIPLLPAGGLNGAIPNTDPYETNFTSGQRNIFRQAFQKRADASLVKLTNFGERYSLKYTFDVFNVTNTSSFDVPGNEVSQNANYNAFPYAVGSYAGGVAPSGNTCSTSGGVASSQPNTGNYFYNCPSGLGQVSHTIGSPRQIQMSLAFKF
jgi:hypothetical protein